MKLDRKTYPDTAKGAIQYLKDDSTLNLKHATAKADPKVDGVWLVKMPKEDESSRYGIVYLAGYKDVWGDIRQENDFETGEGYQSSMIL